MILELQDIEKSFEQPNAGTIEVLRNIRFFHCRR